MQQSHDIKKITDDYRRMDLEILQVQRNVVAPGSKCRNAKTPPVYGFLIPLSGQAKISFDQTPYVMHTGKIFHFAPGMQLDKEVIGQEYWDYMIVTYQPDKTTQLPLYARSHYEAAIHFTRELGQLLLDFYMQCAIPSQFNRQKAKTLFYQLWNEFQIPATDAVTAKNLSLVREIQQFIAQNYMKPLHIPHLAKSYGLTTRPFASLFRQFTGTSPHQYIIHTRIQHAQTLLTEQKFSVAEVSHFVGYTDPYYFSRLFKKHTGMSPACCKKIKTKNNFL